MRTLSFGAGAFLALACTVASPAAAQSGPDVVKARGCLNCHDTAATKIGPSFRDVAAKYRNSRDAAATLAAKLRDGKGHMKVPAADADLDAAVQYVLSVK